MTLLASSKELEDAQRDVNHYDALIKERGKEGCYVGVEERDKYWRAKQCEACWSDEGTFMLTQVVVNSSIHPDTGKPVPLPFRMSAFVPTNLM